MQNDRIQQGRRSPNNFGTPSATLPKNSRTSETEAKRTNKTRSKVWEKVAWFTKRSKNVKEGKTTFDRGKKENEVCLNAGESKCLTQQYDCAVCSVRKLKLKQNGSFYKTKSFSSLKKRKDRQLKERTAAFHCTKHTQVPVCHCDTATGTFHDFGADRRVSGRNKIVGSCNVLSEIAREMNCPPKVNAVDIDYSKSNCDRMAVPSCSVERNRCYAFSGHVYNSWPRKKRSNVCPSAKDTLSPPVKQKRLGVKKTASFNGFDSLGKSNSNESTQFLLETNQIKNQRGFEIGVIHFYKSPKRQENTYKWEKLEKESCEQQKEKADTFSGSDESHLCQDKLLKGDSKGTLQQCMENLNMGDKEMLLEVMNKSGTPEQLCNISYTHLLDPSYDCKKKSSCDIDIDPDVESENTMEGTMYGIDMVPKEFKCTRTESSAALQDSCSKVSFEDYIDKQILNDSNHTISNSVCSDRMDEKESTFCIESHCKPKGSFCNTRSPCRVQHDIESPVKKGGIGLLHLNQKQDENQEASQGCNFCCLAPTCNFNQSSGLSSSNNFDLTSDKRFSTDDSYFKDYSKCDTTELPSNNLICHEIGTLEEMNILPSTETNDSELYIATGEPNNAAVWLQSDTNELPGRLEESACCSESESVPPSLIIPERDDLKERREFSDNTVVQQMTNLKSIPSEICGEKIKPDFREDNSLKIDFADNISVVTGRGSEKYVSIQTLAEKDIPSVNVAQVDRHLINSERLNATKLSNVLQPACNFRDLYQELQFNSEIPFPRINFNNDRSSENSVLTQELTEKRVVVQASPPKVSGTLFKQQLEVMLQWFQEFNHEQRNILLRKVLDHSELPQMHMLSVAMEPLLHKSCPPDCQDMLAWLPNNVTFYVMCLLDPVSLCRCCQVNKHWNGLASNPILWERLCSYKDWQLSRPGEQKQMTKFIAADGNIEWKKMFAERFLLRRNWLKGKCIVRTFKGHAQGISCVQFDDSRIVSGSSDKTIRVWDIHSGEPDAVLTLAGHSGTVRCLNLNGNRLVSGSTDRSIKVWDLSFESYWSGASCKVTMVGHMHTVRCLQVDDNKVVSGSYDKTLKVWSIKTGQCRLTLRGHNAAVLCVQFDDKKIVSGSYDKTIKVWSLSEGSCLMTLTGHHDAVTCLNLTFDGRKVISGSLDHNLKFWDLFTGKCIGTLDWIRSEGHTGVVRCLQADSWRIVSAGDDKTLKVWCLETGQRLLTLRWHTDGVTCLHFNDHRIVSGSYDKTVKLWDFTPVHPFLELEK